MAPAFRQHSFLLPLIAGLLHYAAFPPVSFWPLAFVSLVPLFLFVRAEQTFWRLLLGGFIYCGTYATLAIIFIPDPLVLLFGIGLWLLVFVPGALLVKRCIAIDAVFFVLLSLVVILAEFVASVFSLLPAFLIMSGVSLAGTPFMFVALFGGVVAASIFVALTNAAAAAAFLSFSAQKKSAAAVGLLCCAALLALGASMQLFPKREPSLSLRTMAVSVGPQFAEDASFFEDAVLVRQPYGRESLDRFLSNMLSPIGAAVEQERPELVVLPEGMFDLELPGFGFEPARSTLGITNAGPLLQAYASFAREHRVFVMATLTTFDASGGKYISTILLDPSGKFINIYHKRHLTLYGEYWPFGSWQPFYWKWVSDRMPLPIRLRAFAWSNPTGQYQSGTDVPRFSVAGVPVGVLICLEGQLPQLYWESAQAGNSLVVYTGNDSWLLMLRGVYQALSVKVRQLEVINTRMPLVVAGNAEPASVLFPDGSTFSSPAVISPQSWAYVVR